jgi:hypothetical protein
MWYVAPALYHPMPIPMRAHRAAEMQHLVASRSGLRSARSHSGVNFALPRAYGAPALLWGP